jgi:hypothetical protein
MLISAAIPGASYASGVYTIPISALNTILTQDINSMDSFERLVFALLQVIYEKQTAGTFAQPTCGVEISSTSLSSGTWETSTNVFADRLLSNFLVSFDAGSTLTPLLLDGDTITSA